MHNANLNRSEMVKDILVAAMSTSPDRWTTADVLDGIDRIALRLDTLDGVTKGTPIDRDGIAMSLAPAAARATAPRATHAPVKLDDQARRDIAATSLHMDGPFVAGAHHLARIWPDSPEEDRLRYMALIDKHRLYVGTNGLPLPVKAGNDLISEDGMAVYDPITGQPFSMIKHHLTVAYGMSVEQVRAMFGLTAEQFPQVGPTYSEGKSRAAKKHGLGKNKPSRGGAEQASELTRAV